MKTRATGMLVLLLGVVLSCASLVEGADRKKDEKGSVEKELEKLEADWAAAVETNDHKRIGAFFAEDFLFVGAGGALQDRKQHLEDFRSGRLKVESVKIGDTTIHVYDSAAVVSSRVMVKGRFGDRDISGPYQFTDTWVKQGGRWLAAARQQTRIATPKDGGR